MADETLAPLRDAEIAEIAERCEAATPGPWQRAANGTVADGVWSRSTARLVIASTEYARDLDFVAAARQDIPRLLATLEALDAAIREMRDMHREIVALRVTPLQERLATLSRENAAMREIVAAVAKARGGGTSALYLTIPDKVSDAEAGDYALNLWHRARALLASTQTPATGATAGEEGE